jgi:predicted kinase
MTDELVSNQFIPWPLVSNQFIPWPLGKEKPKRKCKIIVNIGLPGCGKTTETRELMKTDGNLMRVNRDDLRNMLFSRWKGRKESVVTDLEAQAIRAAIHYGYDIIIDDTNLNPGTLAKWKNLANELGVPLVEKSFDVPIEVCIERDVQRTGRAHVGRGVIENMALTYGLIPKLDPEQKVVIFDMDGTMADQTVRRQYIEGEHKDYDLYYNYVSILGDTPVGVVIDWCNACYADGLIVLVVSGRPADRASDATVDWLRMYGVNYHRLFMRPGGDFRDDDIIKQEILDKILKWINKDQILFSVDDRPRIIRMWQLNGITCYDVGKGVEF